jgi:hypothetical protein
VTVNEAGQHAATGSIDDTIGWWHRAHADRLDATVGHHNPCVAQTSGRAGFPAQVVRQQQADVGDDGGLVHRVNTSIDSVRARETSIERWAPPDTITRPPTIT